MRHRLTLLIVLSVLVLILPGQAQEVPAAPTTDVASIARIDPFSRDRISADRLGITFISSTGIPADDNRYQNALRLGAAWNRWPLYWNEVELNPGQYIWDAYDRLVVDDIEHNLSINAILLGRPPFQADGNSIRGLNEPVFTDGSDIPGAGKVINPANPWASFVFSAVSRYRPGGTLAVQRAWTNGEGIRVWEVWNEPDHKQFWQGSYRQYARLLKVAYLSAHHAYPEANVMFGGLLYPTPVNWLAQVLSIFSTDPQRQANNWYMDSVGVHSYAYPWRSGWLVRYAKQTLRAYDLDRPIWLNESGVQAWDDYPGPVWAIQGTGENFKQANLSQQAWFFIQSTAFAWAEGAEVVFYHQLYDDCGNQPAGTNFPPHNGELCSSLSPCFGDSFGLYRNPSGAVCFSQHPQPNTPRPASLAFRMLAEVFQGARFSGGDVTYSDEGAIRITFEDSARQQRIHIMWNRTFAPIRYRLEAGGSQALLYTFAGTNSIAPDAGGNYRIDLPQALPDNYPELENNDITAIGGPPVILVERADGILPTPVNTLSPDTVAVPVQQPTEPYLPVREIPPTVVPTPGAILPPPARATTAPEEDRQPPVASVDPLPEISSPTFTVTWQGEDNSRIERYLIWVQIDDEGWMPWIETTRTQADYTGESGSRYDFAAWAVDAAGNWSLNVNLDSQASTQVE